jgi:RNA-directed DNA polymerase
VVNGPEDEPCSWESVSWLSAEDNVRRLRQRIFTASQAGDLKRVRNLQKLMLRSRSGTLLSVRRVTELNAGRKTAGINGERALTPQARADLADWVQHQAQPWKARPVKRVYIPKKGVTGKRRPLGIPVIADRVQQARVASALEPEWEARLEPRSYGFRPGRGCHDAIEAIFQVSKGVSPRRRWVLDADLAAAFDRIDHGRFAPTGEGAPQGGVISPLLLNVALHGMEQAAGVRYERVSSDAAAMAAGSPVLVRYADLCRARHKSAYAEARVMPTRLPDARLIGRFTVPGSA